MRPYITIPPKDASRVTITAGPDRLRIDCPTPARANRLAHGLIGLFLKAFPDEASPVSRDITGIDAEIRAPGGMENLRD